jgi:hypothetical protein
MAELLAMGGDTALDVAIESGSFNQIPIVGLVFGMAKSGRDLRERYLLRKLARFLYSSAALSTEERNHFSLGFESEAEQEDFGARLLILVERADDLEKPKILGRLLVAHARGAFSRNSLLRMSLMVDRSLMDDLELLKTFREGRMPSIEAQALISAGWIHLTVIDGGSATMDGFEGGNEYAISEYGLLLAKYGLEAGIQ